MTADELSRAWLAAWSQPDREGFAAVCAPNVHHQDPLTPIPLCGAGALAEHASLLRAGLPDARLEPAGGRPCADGCLAVPWRLRGTHTGELGEIPPTGRFVSIHGVFYCELDGSADGDDDPGSRVVRSRAFFDLYDAGRQLGVLPARGTLRERALVMLGGFGLRG